MTTPFDFDRVVVIGLRRRPERLRRFWRELPEPWPFRQPLHIAAIDGTLSRPPDWYRPTAKADHGRLHRPQMRNAPDLSGAWGCLRSHHRVWEDALNDGLGSVLVFEDDAIFDRQFNVRLLDFLNSVPDDWDQLYLGGQHLGVDGLWPEQVSEQVIRGRYVNRTHAYAIRREMMQAAYSRFLTRWDSQDPRMFHLDHQLCQMHRAWDRELACHIWNIYCPRKWLVGQASEVSDVKQGRPQMEHWWNDFEVKPCEQSELAASGCA